MTNEPKNIAERFEMALRGNVFITKSNSRRNGALSLVNYNFPTRFSSTAYLNSMNLHKYVEYNDSKLQREVAELSWIYSIATAVNKIAALQVYDKDANGNILSARNSVTEIRKNIKSTRSDYYNDEKYKASLDALEKQWKARYDSKSVSSETLNETYKYQNSLVQEFFSSALELNIADVASINRAKNFINTALASVNIGEDRPSFIKSKLPEYNSLMYGEFLISTYGANRNNLTHLGQKILSSHFSEIEAFTSRLTYSGSSGRAYPFDINHNDIKTGVHITEGTGEIRKALKDFHNVANKKAAWSIAYNVIQTDENKIIFNATASLVGRVSHTYTVVPRFVDWLNTLEYYPPSLDGGVGTYVSSYEQKIQERLAKLEQEQAENEVQRQKRLAEILAAEEEKAKKVELEIDRHYESPVLTPSNVQGTYIEKKGLTDLVSYPELNGLMRKSSKYGLDCISIAMGTSPLETRGIQFLGSKSSPWTLNDKSQDKLFDTRTDDMKNNFVQLGDITSTDTLIVTSEGFATAATLYIAAKSKELDVVVIAAMYADNVKYAVNHYAEKHPNNPIYNASDNDCWDKKQQQSRSLIENKGFCVALQLKDMIGIDSFSLDWGKLSVRDEAQRKTSTDFNDLFDLYDKNSAIDIIGNQLESLYQSTHTLPKDWKPEHYVFDSEFQRAPSKSLVDLFERFSIDPQLNSISFPLPTSNFVTPEFGTDTIKPASEELSISDTELENIHGAQDDEVKLSASSISLQKYTDGAWVDIDYRSDLQSSLNTLQVEKDWAESKVFSSISADSDVDSVTARLMAKNQVEASYRCYDNDLNVPFSSTQEYIANHDDYLDQAVVILAKNRGGNFVLPVKDLGDEQLVFRGKGLKRAPIVRFNSKIEIACVIDQFINESYFSDADDFLNDEDFKLAPIDTEGNIDHSSKKTFFDMFGMFVAEGAEQAADLLDIDAELPHSPEENTVEITFKPNGGNSELQSLKIPESELAITVQQLNHDPKVAYVDSSAVESKDLDIKVKDSALKKPSLTVKSYSKSGVSNATYDFESEKAALAKSSELDNYGSSTVFVGVNGHLSPLQTTLKSIVDIKIKPILSYTNSLGENNDADFNMVAESLLTSLSLESLRNEPIYKHYPLEPIAIENGKLVADLGHSKQETTFDEYLDSLVQEHNFSNSTEQKHTQEPTTSKNNEYRGQSSSDSSFILDLLEGDLKRQSKEEIYHEYDYPQHHDLDHTGTQDFISPTGYKFESDRIVDFGVEDTDSNSLIDLLDDTAPTQSIEEPTAVATETIPDVTTPEQTSLGDAEGKAIDEPTAVATETIPDVTAPEQTSLGDADGQAIDEPTAVATETISDVTAPEQTSLVDAEGKAIDEPTAVATETISDVTAPEQTSLFDADGQAIDEPTAVSTETIPDVTAPEQTSLVDADGQAIDEPTAVATETIPEVTAPEQTSLTDAKELAIEDPAAVATEMTSDSKTLEQAIRASIDKPSASSLPKIELGQGYYFKPPRIDEINWSNNFNNEYSISKSNANTGVTTVVLDRTTNFAVTSEQDVVSDLDAQLLNIIQRAKKKAFERHEQNLISSLDIASNLSEIIESVPQTTSESFQRGATNDVRLNFLDNVAPSSEKSVDVDSQIDSDSTIDLLADLDSVEEATSNEPEVRDNSPATSTELLSILQHLVDTPEKNRSAVLDALVKAMANESKTVSSDVLTHPVASVESQGSEVDIDDLDDKKANISSDRDEGDISNNAELKSLSTLYSNSSNYQELIDSVKATHGDLGGMAVVKRACFMAVSESDIELGSSEQLNIIRRVVANINGINEQSDNFELGKAETTAKEIDTWINNVAFVGVYIERTKERGDTYNKFSEFDKSMKNNIYKYMITPMKESAKTKGSRLLKDWFALKDCIEQRQIPETTLKQALIGKWLGRTKDSETCKVQLNEGVNKCIMQAIKQGLIVRSDTEHNTFLYKTDQGVNGQFDLAKLRYKTAIQIAETEVAAAKSLPRNPKNYSREAAYVLAGRAFQELTDIDSPFSHLGEAKVPYRGVGRGLDGSKKEKKESKEAAEVER